MNPVDIDELQSHVSRLWPRTKLTDEIAMLWVEGLRPFHIADVKLELNRQKQHDMAGREPHFASVKNGLYRLRAKQDRTTREHTPSYALFARMRDKWTVAAELCAQFDAGAIDAARLDRWDEAVQQVTTLVGSAKAKHKPTTAAYCRRMVSKLVPAGYATQTWREQVLDTIDRETSSQAQEVPF